MHIVRIYSRWQVFPQKGNAPQFPVAICLYMTAVFHNYFIGFLCIIDRLTPLNFSYNVTKKKNICSIFLKILLSVISIKEQKG